jgi:hypothetical protein
MHGESDGSCQAPPPFAALAPDAPLRERHVTGIVHGQPGGRKRGPHALDGAWELSARELRHLLGFIVVRLGIESIWRCNIMQTIRRIRLTRAGHGTLLLFGVALVLSACGQGGPGAAHGTLTGVVQASPTCPVEHASQPCPPAPVPNREVRILDANGAVAASTKTDIRGHFSLTIAPGAYVVEVAIVSGQIGMRQTTPGNVTVVSGQTATITIVLDTGLR